MNTQEAARSNLERAGMILEEAHRFWDRGAWNLVVRRCQEVLVLDTCRRLMVEDEE